MVDTQMKPRRIVRTDKTTGEVVDVGRWDAAQELRVFYFPLMPVLDGLETGTLRQLETPNAFWTSEEP